MRASARSEVYKGQGLDGTESDYDNEEGGGKAEEEGGKKREEKKRRERLEDSYLCYSTDAQQSHVSMVHILLSDMRFP